MHSLSRFSRTLIICGLAAGSTLLPAGRSLAAPREMPPGKPAEQRNAALVYWKAWTVANQDAMKADIDWNAIGSNLDPAKMPESFTKVAAGMDAYRDAMGDLLLASRMPVCDFELAYENGFELVMPHLSKLRGGARLLRVEARSLLMNGKPADAAERVAAMLRMSRQLKDDGILISSLVGMAIASAGIEEGQTLIGSGRLSRADAAPLVDAARKLAGRDALGVRSCIIGEGTVLKDWLGRRYTGPTAGADFINGFGKELSGVEQTEHSAAQAAISKMNARELEAEAVRTFEAYKLIDQAWDQPDVSARLDSLSDRVAKGEFGQLAVMIFPNFNRARASQAKFDSTLAEFSKSLAELK